MVIALGLRTTQNPNPNGSNPYTISHTHGTSLNSVIIANFIMTNSRQFTTCTYGGIAMSLIANQNFGGLSQTTRTYILQDPPSGNNFLSINFSGGQFNAISIYCRSLQGAKISTNPPTLLSGASSPRVCTINNVSNGSVLFTYAVSIGNIFSLTTPGSTTITEFQHNTNRQVRGCLLFPPITSAGSYGSVGQSTSNLTCSVIEIEEAGTPSVESSGDMFLMF